MRANERHDIPHLDMVLNTRRMFAALLPALEIDTVCDVGSMNGAEALVFRRAVPRARLFAFEPNPENLRLLQADARMREHGIEIVPVAVTDYDGEAQFHLVKADYSAAHDRRGMSSLYERAEPGLRDRSVTTRTARLDTILGGEPKGGRRIAMWIDVEGKAFEALTGAAGILDEVQLLHVEVESLACIGAAQKLYPDVKALLASAGFFELATDRAPHEEQFNALFLRSHLTPSQRSNVSRLAQRNRVRQWFVNALRRACPLCVRRLRSLLARA
jgi:FkbM family methyltransferase